MNRPPSMEQLLETILKNQQLMQQSLLRIENKFSEVRNDIACIKVSLKNDIASIKESLESRMQKNIGIIKEQISQINLTKRQLLENHQKQSDIKIEKLEKRSKKSRQSIYFEIKKRLGRLVTFNSQSSSSVSESSTLSVKCSIPTQQSQKTAPKTQAKTRETEQKLYEYQQLTTSNLSTLQMLLLRRQQTRNDKKNK